MSAFTCPVVETTVAGRRYTLRMDFNAIALAEKETGCNFLNWDEDVNVSAVTALFWACAYQTDKSVKLADIRALGPNQLVDIVNACNKAWHAVNDVPPEDPRPIDGSKPRAGEQSAV